MTTVEKVVLTGLVLVGIGVQATGTRWSDVVSALLLGVILGFILGHHRPHDRRD